MKLLIGLVLMCIMLLGCSDPAQQPPTTPPPPPPAVTYTDPPQFGTPFDVPDTKEIVMYEVNLRAFSAQGTFAGVTARLDSIKALGANTIWLMPIYPVGVLNSVGQLGLQMPLQHFTSFIKSKHNILAIKLIDGNL